MESSGKMSSEKEEKIVASSERSGMTPTPPGTHVPVDSNNKDLDLAFKYINNAKDDDEVIAHDVDLKALRRRIDWRILPVMFLVYAVGFLDKVILNVSHSASLFLFCSLHG
jgi:hypothetical protein